MVPPLVFAPRSGRKDVSGGNEKVSSLDPVEEPSPWVPRFLCEHVIREFALVPKDVDQDGVEVLVGYLKVAPIAVV